MASEKITAKELIAQCFDSAETQVNQQIIFGTGKIKNQQFTILGTVEDTSFGVDEAMEMARHVLQLIILETQEDKKFFGLLAYQRFLLAMDDINILYRTGFEGLHFARSQIEQGISINNREQSIQEAIRLHALFSQNNISPGGVADMLGLLYFLHHVFSGALR
jgi:triphosphoribosyl-dephospho-CoA synthase